MLTRVLSCFTDAISVVWVDVSLLVWLWFLFSSLTLCSKRKKNRIGEEKRKNATHNSNKQQKLLNKSIYNSYFFVVGVVNMNKYKYNFEVERKKTTSASYNRFSIWWSEHWQKKHHYHRHQWQQQQKLPQYTIIYMTDLRYVNCERTFVGVECFALLAHLLRLFRFGMSATESERKRPKSRKRKTDREPKCVSLLYSLTNYRCVAAWPVGGSCLARSDSWSA